MAQIDKGLAIALPRDAAMELPKSGGVVVSSRRGLHEEWIPLTEAEGLVHKTTACFLRDDVRSYQLMLDFIPPGDVYRFDVDSVRETVK
jgi:hypothetical protein